MIWDKRKEQALIWNSTTSVDILQLRPCIILSWMGNAEAIIKHLKMGRQVAVWGGILT
jgi:hypothetical protein